MELIQEETLEISQTHKSLVLQYLEQLGFRLYVSFSADRLGMFHAGHEEKHCNHFQRWIDKFSMVDVSVTWVALPDVEEAVLHPSLASLYTYGENRASHFSFVPFCAGKTLKDPGDALCWHHYVAVRKGSAMERHPAFSPEGHVCASNPKEERSRFRKAVRDGLKEAVSKGWSRRGKDLERVFVTKDDKPVQPEDVFGPKKEKKKAQKRKKDEAPSKKKKKKTQQEKLPRKEKSIEEGLYARGGREKERPEKDDGPTEGQEEDGKPVEGQKLKDWWNGKPKQRKEL